MRRSGLNYTFVLLCLQLKTFVYPHDQRVECSNRTIAEIKLPT